MGSTTLSSISKRLVASYVIDWILVIGFALIAYGFDQLTPHYHNFSVLDLSISYPLRADTVPIWVVGVVAGIVPAAIVFIMAWTVVPGPAALRSRDWRTLARMKVWEWNSGWLGLALSLALSLMITLGLKNFGKPRPNMLARCQPDLANLQDYVVGGYGGDISERWMLVDQRICQQTDLHVLNDGFQSWPSGHSTTAWAGLLYLTLYLCSKLAVVIPYLPSRAWEDEEQTAAPPSQKEGNASIDTQRKPMLSTRVNPGNTATAATTRTGRRLVRHRDEAAAPPVYGLLAIIVPIGGALYISLSRYMDYAHHGFDILSGSVIGIVCAWFSFRLYHLPIARGSGWSWGPRSRGRAFGVGVGSHGYVDESRFFKPKGSDDVEMGDMGADGVGAVNGNQRWASDVHATNNGMGGSNYSQASNLMAPSGSSFSQPTYAREARHGRPNTSSETEQVDVAHQPRVY